MYELCVSTIKKEKNNNNLIYEKTNNCDSRIGYRANLLGGIIFDVGFCSANLPSSYACDDAYIDSSSGAWGGRFDSRAVAKNRIKGLEIFSIGIVFRAICVFSLRSGIIGSC